MRTNTWPPRPQTHEGAPAQHVNAEQRLRRSVMSCMLWEREFYEDGESIANRIGALVQEVAPDVVAEIAIEARERMKLRHAPLWIAAHAARLASHKRLLRTMLGRIIRRADEPAEFVALYWKACGGRKTLPKGAKRGLADAFRKFDEYQLAKYDRDGAIKLRDVLFLVHAKPADDAQAALWKRLIAGELATPDTWEVALSATGGEGKRETWARLLREQKLGGLALIRNLRNMLDAKVDETAIRTALVEMKTDRVLPFRFIAAARHAPRLEQELESAMLRSVTDSEKLPGTTVLLVDVSGSMDAPISMQSEMLRVDAACGLAVLCRELCERVRILTFSSNTVEVPARRGFALRDAVQQSQPHSSTELGAAVEAANAIDCDRLMVITDEQSRSPVGDPNGRGYMINVASAANGIGYGQWTHIDGWSEAVIDYIREVEKLESDDTDTQGEARTGDDQD